MSDVRELIESAEAESLRMIAYRMARDNSELSIELQRLRYLAERWRSRWVYSFGANLLAVALVIWYPLIRSLFNW